MIALILLGASILSHASAFLGITQAISGWVTALNLSPIGLITILIGLYIVLGAFLDGSSMMVLTLPIVLPIVTAAGFDPIWFGVFLVIFIRSEECRLGKECVSECSSRGYGDSSKKKE